MSLTEKSLAGLYKLRNWMQRGGKRIKPGTVVELCHEDAVRALAQNTAEPHVPDDEDADCTKCSYKPCSVECYVKSGNYKAEDFDAFVAECERRHDEQTTPPESNLTTSGVGPTDPGASGESKDDKDAPKNEAPAAKKPGKGQSLRAPKGDESKDDKAPSEGAGAGSGDDTK